ncbi:MAG: tRNA (guanine(46)-N(7))-methyltransferase TrmB [Pseudomonadota bacterium]
MIPKDTIEASYRGRRVRKLRPALQRNLDARLPFLSLEHYGQALWSRIKQNFLPGYEALWVEAGFGAGEHLLAQARANPHIAMIGCEPYAQGHGALIGAMEKDPVPNVRLYVGMVQHLLASLPDGVLDRFTALFPDPWPKRRHQKRRMFNAQMVCDLARVLKSGGMIYMASDHPLMVDWALWQMRACDAFIWQHHFDWQTQPTDSVPTRYQQKALAGKASFLFFQRR